jgi:hypothetical protein
MVDECAMRLLEIIINICYNEIMSTEVTPAEIEELIRTIDTVEFESGSRFNFRDKMYLLFMCDQASASDGYSEGTYFSSNVADWDIYLLEKLNLHERKRVLFHEVLETYLRDKGLETENAHAKALEIENTIFGDR